MSALHETVLELDKTYAPNSVITVREALEKLVDDTAAVVDANYVTYSFTDWLEYCKLAVEEQGIESFQVVRSPKHVIIIPSIIVLQDFSMAAIGKQRQVRLSRSNIIFRDKHCCQYCGKFFNKRDLTIDHVTPKCQGGRNTWLNTVASCRDCNLSKGGRTPFQANMPLLTQPTIPIWGKLLHIPDHKKHLWSAFL